MRLEGDLQGLENRHFHRCLLLQLRNNYDHWKLGVRSSRCFPYTALVPYYITQNILALLGNRAMNCYINFISWIIEVKTDLSVDID